jgi:hypothetical protein
MAAQPLRQRYADLRQVDRQVVAEVGAPKLGGARVLATPRGASDEEIGKLENALGETPDVVWRPASDIFDDLLEVVRKVI